MVNLSEAQRLLSIGQSHGDLLVQVLGDISAKIDKISEENAKTREMIEDHITGEAHLLAVINSAFPGNDPDGHRQYHAAQIEKIERMKEFWQKMMFEFIKWGLLGAIGWLALQAWSGFLKGPR